MGCVLQPGEDIPTSALKPGDQTSESVQPGQDIDDCFVAPVETLNLTNANISEISPAPVGDKVAGYELQGDGNVYSITSDDTNSGPPTFQQLNNITDWIDNKSYVGTYHARMNKTGGAGSLSGGSAPLNVWREIGVDSAIWDLLSGNGAGNVQWFGTIEISDDGGSTTIDSASVSLETDEVP